MTILQVASSVTTWISLASFIVAAILIAYRSSLQSRENRILAAPPDKRLDMAIAEAQKNGVDVSRLTPDQVFAIVNRNIITKRYYAFLALVIATLIAIVCISYFILFHHVVNTQTVGPLTLASGETRPVVINLDSRNKVVVTIDSIVPDWTGLEEKHRQWIAAGRGNTPEIWFKICGVTENIECHKLGAQRGVHEGFGREIDAGLDYVTFVNFNDNPPISFSATIKY